MSRTWEENEFVDETSIADSEIYTDGGSAVAFYEEDHPVNDGSQIYPWDVAEPDSSGEPDALDDEIVQAPSRWSRSCGWIRSHRILSLGILAALVVAVLLGVILPSNEATSSRPSDSAVDAGIQRSSPTNSPAPPTLPPASLGPIASEPTTSQAPAPALPLGPPMVPFETPAGLSQGPSSTASDEPSASPSIGAPVDTLPIMEQLQVWSDPDALSDPDSPQFQAADWLINNDDPQLAENPPNLQERYALAVLYFTTNGDGWAETRGFLGSDEVCAWDAIQCSEDHVTRVDLAENGLDGSLPSELRLLEYAEVLIFRQNSIKGDLPPELTEMSRLEDLTLHFNQITSLPTEIGTIATLRKLMIDNNSIGSSIPSELGLLSDSLERLSLSTNFMIGEIPIELYALTKLKTLRMERNSYVGSFSSLIGNLVELTNLSIQNNQLEGAIPSEIGLLSKLEKFQSHWNGFTGDMPTEICSLGLERLRTDCLAQSDGVVQVGCSCCNECCSNTPRTCG